MAEQGMFTHPQQRAASHLAAEPLTTSAPPVRQVHLPERRLAGHLFLACTPEQATETEQRMRSLYQRLLIDIRRFHRLAARYSDADNGGALGWVTRGMLPAALERVLFAMESETLSPIFRTPEGFHVLYCSGIRPHGVWLPPASEA